MVNELVEKTLARVILIGAPFATLFVVTDTVTDPVNSPKLLIAGGLGFSVLAMFLIFGLKANLRNFRLFICSNVLFIFAALNAILQSKAPSPQQIYGVYGRNTGLIAYLALSFIAIGSLNLHKMSSYKNIIHGLQFAGFINVIYCAWALAFGDFVGWSNPYGNILGLFGNPNFISSFLGIFIASLAAFSFAPTASIRYKFFGAIIGILAFYEIIQSRAIQGIVVTVAGLGIVLFYAIRSRFNSPLISVLYLCLFSLMALLSLFGALQRGPFDFIYKRSVSLRGIYWQTAVNIGKDHPLSGVGLDTYGDWYRQARPIKAITEPGVNTTTNAAHSVPLDFFASGGWPLFLSYLAVISLGALAILRVTLRKKQYDGVFVALAVSWICYQLQSIISINQIGLAIWGWLLTGSLIAYEFRTRENEKTETELKARTRGNKILRTSNVISPQMVAGVGMVVGLLVASPPMAGDSKWRGALDSKDVNQVLAALDPGYLSPSDSQRYAQAVQLFANSNLMDQAHEIAVRAVKFNPDNYQAWRNLYFLPNSTQVEKSRAVRNLKRLDPNNPDVTKP